MTLQPSSNPACRSARFREKLRLLSATAAMRGRLTAQILEFERRINAWHRSIETPTVDDLPRVDPTLATSMVASVPVPAAFRSGRDFSAWIGLVPKQNSSGGKARLGHITCQGDRYLRSRYCAGALAVIRYPRCECSRRRSNKKWAGHGSAARRQLLFTGSVARPRRPAELDRDSPSSHAACDTQQSKVKSRWDRPWIQL